MATVTLFDPAGQALGHTLAGSAAAQLLRTLGIEAGAWALRAQPLSSVPWLTYARELQAMQRRFGSLRTDRLRRRGAMTPRDTAGLPKWPEPDAAHSHDDLELRVVLDGAARFVVHAPAAGGWVAVDGEAGDWVALPPGLVHAFFDDAARGIDMLRIFTRPQGWRAEPAALPVPPALARREWARFAPELPFRMAA